MIGINFVLSDIGLKRIKSELKQYVQDKYIEINTNRELQKLYNMKVGLFKQFREELLSLYLYSQLDGSIDNRKYQLVIGDQPYDAIIYTEYYAKKVEFTELIDGKQIHEDMKKLLKDHFVMFEVEDCFAAEDKFLEMFEKLVMKKKSKIYENTLIIFIIAPYHLNFLHSSEIDSFKKSLINIIKRYDFSSNNVSLLIKPLKNIQSGEVGELINII